MDETDSKQATPSPSASPCRPAAPEEPILVIDEIQGNILVGFNKDFEALLFFRIVDAALFRTWLQGLVGRITTTRDVLLFRRSLHALRRRGAERTVRATWLQVAFSRRGLEKLVTAATIGEFRDEAFQQGLASRAEKVLGDPTGAATKWVIGGPENEADALVLVAADEARDLEAEIVRLTSSATASGASLLLGQRGARLPERNREHFGFRDGISQPGIRGRLSQDPHDLFTPRENPADPYEGKPGQTLVWPGEFIFGYAGQDPTAKAGEGGVLKMGLNSLGVKDAPLAPTWAANGSYLVFRRLRQDVRAFHSFIRREADRLSLPADVLEAKVVGRFRSGAPIARTAVDNPGMGADDCANNDFRFVDSPTVGPRVDDCQCTRSSPPAAADSDGLLCPFAAHIRKNYPRYDAFRFGLGHRREDTETHRLLRRAIPFGPPYPDPEPEDFQDAEERGLLFLAYQTSIVEQFEHIHSAWVNKGEQLKVSGAKLEFSAGQDLLIGQSPKGRRLLLRLPDGAGGVRFEMLAPEDPFVIATGGGYFFVPSITAVGQIARGEL